jgi:hypothetical protein
MSDKARLEHNADMPDELRAALFSIQRSAPAGFVDKTVVLFESALAKKRVRRLVLGLSFTFLVNAAGAWAVLLNAFGLADAIWSGLVSAVAFMGSVMTVWDYLPVTSALFSLALMAVTALSLGLLRKLDKPSLSRIRA